MATFDLTRICSSTRPERVATQDGFGPGEHTFQVVGKIEDLATIKSGTATFTLSCEPDGGASDGCAAGGNGRAHAGLVVLLVVAARARRRR